MNQSHTIQWCEEIIEDRTLFGSNDQGETSLDNEGGEFHLETLVSFGIGKKETTHRIAPVRIAYVSISICGTMSKGSTQNQENGVSCCLMKVNCTAGSVSCPLHDGVESTNFTYPH